MISPIYFIVGPTAIGKSKLALDLAKKINGHIINADSMQVYKDLNVLTARPSKKEIKQINHHLYGYIKSSDRYNVARWCEDASRKIKKLSEKKIPSILVGGTGMYIDKLINGLADIPTIPEEYKYESEKALNKMGISNFYKLISSFDDESLSKFVYNIHEHVNKNLGKISTLTYDQVRDRYENFRSRCANKKTKKVKKFKMDGADQKKLDASNKKCLQQEKNKNHNHKG